MQGGQAAANALTARLPLDSLMDRALGFCMTKNFKPDITFLGGCRFSGRIAGQSA